MENRLTKMEKYKAAIWGLIVGDALGVPVEFQPRSSLKVNPVTDMRGYGKHNQPPGTWSDDSSMVLATLEWLGESKKGELDYLGLMNKFQKNGFSCFRKKNGLKKIYAKKGR